MPSRRIRGLVPLFAVLAVVVSLLLFRQPLGRFVLGRVLAALGRALNGSVSCSRIAGDIFARPQLYELRVVSGSDSIKAESVKLDYDLLGMLRGRFSFREVLVSGLRVYLATQRAATQGTKPPGRIRLPRAAIERLCISQAQVVLDSQVLVDSLGLELNVYSRPRLLQAELDSFTAVFAPKKLAVRRMRARLELTPDTLRLIGFELATPASVLTGDLKLGLNDNGLSLRVSELRASLPELLNQPGWFRFHGEGRIQDKTRSASGRYAATELLLGQVTLPEITGHLRLQNNTVELSAAGADTALGEFDLAGRVDIKTLAFAVEAKLRNLALRRLINDLPNVRLGARVVASGQGIDSIDCTIAASASELGVESLRAAVNWRRAVNRQQLRVEEFAIAGPLGQLAGNGQWQDGRVQASVRFDRLDAGLLGNILAVPASGQFDGELTMLVGESSTRAFGDVTASGLTVARVTVAHARAALDLSYQEELLGMLTLDAESLTAAGVNIDHASIGLDSGRLDLRLRLPQNELVAAGDVRLRTDRLDLTATSFRFSTEQETLVTTQPFRLVVFSDSVLLRGVAAAIAGGRLEFDLAAAAKGLPRLRLAARQLDIAQLAGLFRLNESCRGTLDVDINGQDTMVVELRISQPVLPVIGLELASAVLGARISRDRLRIDSLALISADPTVPDTSRISGTVALNLNGSFALGPADLDIALRNPGAWALFFLAPTFAVRQPLIYGDVQLSGELTRPRLKGRARISRARVLMPDFNLAVERVAAELTFDSSRITLQKIAGESGKGMVFVNGFVDLGANWVVDSVQCDVQFSGVTFNPEPELFAIGSGRLRVDWSPIKPLSLAGQVDVDEALIAYGFGRPALPPSRPDTTLLYDVRVRGERNIWLRNQLADIEFGIDLNVRKTRTDAIYSGELVSRQGSLYYLDHTLRVDSGVVRFENINRLDPDLAIVAAMPVRALHRNGGAETPERIVITLTGTLEQPVFDLASDPPGWGAEEIASYLSLNVTPDELNALDQKEAVTRLLSDRLLSYFQIQAAKRARSFASLDYLEFETGLISGRDTRVTVGKYIGRNLYVSYAQSFTGDLQPVFRVEYYLNRRNELVAGRSEDGRYSLRYRFKLRY